MLEDREKRAKVFQCICFLYVTNKPSSKVSISQVLSGHVTLAGFAIN